MPAQVVVGVDGSRESLAAVDWAADEAAAREGVLHLVSATRWEKQPHVVMPSYAAEDWGRRLLREAEQRVRERRPDLEVTTREVEDEPAAVLLSAAEKAPLLVLGSRGLGEAAAFFVGSVAQSAVARATAPVVLVRPERDRAGVRRAVVLGLDDLRQPADELLGFAFDAAARRNAALRIVHTWRHPAPHRPRSGEPDQGVRTRRAEELAGTLRPFRDRRREVRVETDLGEGRQAERLVTAAAAAELLVVGRHRTGTRHIGAVTHAVVHHAPCPVAVVPHT